MAALATAAAILVVVLGAAWLFSSTDGEVVNDPVVTPVPPTTVATTIPETTAAVFDVATDALCEFFSGEEILEITKAAYAAESVSYWGPDEPPYSSQTANGRGWGEGAPGCKWAVSGTPGFTVLMTDQSENRLFVDGDEEVPTGPTQLEGYHNPAGHYPADSYEHRAALYGVEDLVPEGMNFLGGFSPGFSVYVEETDRLIGFQHNLGATANEWYRIEVRILTAMLERMGWLPEPASTSELNAETGSLVWVADSE